MPTYNTYPISVYTEGMVKVDDLVAYTNVTISHVWKGYRTISLDMQTNVDGSEHLVPPNYIAVTTPTGTYGGVIYHRHFTDKQGSAGRTQTMRVEACSPVGFFQKRYILTYSESDAGGRNRKFVLSGRMETVAKQFIGLCTGGDYYLPDFRVAPDYQRGDKITYQSSYESLFTIITNLFNANSLLSYDVTFTETDGFTFDVVAARDLSGKVIMASEQNVFSSFEHEVDFLNSSNDTPMIVKGEAFYLQPNVTARGYHRHTEIIKANVDPGYLGAAGLVYSLQNAYVMENHADRYHGVLRSDTQKYFFNTDYQLGDIINIYYRIGSEDINVQKRVYAVTETIDKEQGYRISITLDAAHHGILRTFVHIKDQIERNMRGA
jgi:hypothetical protein